jgi:Uma2 family endonuclease
MEEPPDYTGISLKCLDGCPGTMASSSSRSERQGTVKRMAAVRNDRMTTQEYLDTPESKKPTELIYGALRVADSPMPRHQAAVGDIFMALAPHVRERRLGDVWLSPLDVIFDVHRALILQPDLFFVSTERSYTLTDRMYGAPDLVVEVLSPDPRIGKLAERIAWFAEYGVRECWLLHQFERRLEVLRFAEGNLVQRASFEANERIRSSVLPDFDRNLDSILRWT